MKSLLHPGKLKIIVPHHNAGAYLGECLQSLVDQDFDEWTAYLADDASNDGSREIVQPYIEDSRFKVLRREERRYLMGNLYAALLEAELKPCDVVVILDGDDALLPGALSRIMAEHAEGYDLVYTDMRVSSGAASIGRALLPNVPPRQQSWCISHLRSFKAYLFQGLGPEHFQDDGGRFFRAAGDLSLFFPLIERAGLNKVSFVEEKLHFYRLHEHCNHVVLREEQLANNRLLRSRPALPLQTEFFDHVVDVPAVDPFRLRETAAKLRRGRPLPWSILCRCLVDAKDLERYRAYSDLWIGEGVYLKMMER
jgi:glycosyltransferase involved in cell wall biosynthesis